MTDGPAPGQRGAREDAVLGMLLDGMREVKEQVVRLENYLAVRLDGLDARYVPRTEYEARHSDLRNIATKTDARVDAEATKTDTRVSTLEEKLTMSRRFAVTTSSAAFVGLVALLALILSHH